MCGKSYKYRAGLYNHRRYECGKEPQFYCHFCPYKCKQKSGLKTHLKTKHGALLYEKQYIEYKCKLNYYSDQ